VKLGVSSYFFSLEGFKGVISECFNYGLRCVEIAYEIPFVELLDRAFFDELKRWKEDGMSFSMHGPWIECNLASHFREIRDFSRQRIMEAIDVASEMGMDPFVLHPGFNFVMDRRWHMEEKAMGYFADELFLLREHAERRGVRLCLENMPFAFSFFSLASEPGPLAEDCGLSVCYDVGHAAMSKLQAGLPSPQESILSDLRQYIGGIGHVHIHNNFGARDEHSLYSGLLNLKAILKTLMEEGFEGMAVFESTDIETYGFATFAAWLKKT
jgi:sugar phosphate isomerase/epimerase